MTTIFEVSKEIRWEMAHRLVEGYRGKCNSLHGHSWVARVYIGGSGYPGSTHKETEVLDKFGMLIDFGDFTPVRNWIDRNWDHATMLAMSDPLNDLFIGATFEVGRIFTMEGNPTSENIARFLYNKVYELLPNLVPCQVTHVDVLETCTSMASYWGG
jgi:6-pyruvoyl tetrahydropterin synthase/QueD family protein